MTSLILIINTQYLGKQIFNNISVRMNMLEFKCQQLEKEVLMLKQELEFRNMETAEYRDREIQLKRMNESLVKALEQQKPNNPYLTEIKLMVEQYGGGEKQKALEAELDRIKRNIENEVAQRVRGIVLETEIKFKTCSRCRDLDSKVSEMELEISRLKSRNATQTDYIAELEAKYREAMDQLQIKQAKLLDAEMDFKRFRDETDMELQRKKSSEDVNTRVSELEMRDLIANLERKKEEELNEYKRKLDRNFESTLEQNIEKIKRQYHQQYQQKSFELQRKLYQQKQSFTRKQQDLKKKTSRMTPIKTLAFTQQAQNYQQPQQFNIYKTEGVRTAVSPTWRKQNKNYAVNAMQGEIKSIINGMARNKQQDFRGGESQISHVTGYSTGGYYPDDEASEYSNFSIKEAIIRPNNLMENHYKLKNARFY